MTANLGTGWAAQIAHGSKMPFPEYTANQPSIRAMLLRRNAFLWVQCGFDIFHYRKASMNAHTLPQMLPWKPSAVSNLRLLVSLSLKHRPRGCYSPGYGLLNCQRTHRRAAKTTTPTHHLRTCAREAVDISTDFICIDTVVPAMHRHRPKTMIPAIPARSRKHRRGGMPAAISYNRLPSPSAAIVIVTIHVLLVASWAAILGRAFDVDGIAGLCAVHIPDKDSAVVGTGVNIAAVCAAGRREVAADEGFEDLVAGEGDDRAIVWMWAMVFHVVRGEAVIEVGSVVLSID